MRKLHTNIQIFYIILVLVLLFNGNWTFSAYAAMEKNPLLNTINPFKPKLPEPEPEKPVSQPTAKAPAAPVHSTTVPTKPAVIAPPAPAPVPLPELPHLTVSGLIWNSDRPQAIINGEIKGINDRVSFLTVTKIDKSGVHLTAVDGRTMFITPGGETP